MVSKVLFCLYVVYCLEVGVFLLFFPWTRLWDQNALLDYYPYVRAVFLNNFFRGGVTGLGIANLFLGVWEVAHFRQYFRPKSVIHE